MALLKTNGGGLTFVELETIPGFVGEMDMVLRNRNVILWTGVSIEASQAIQDMRNDEIIEFESTFRLTYGTCGKFLRLPLVSNSAATRILKNKHWSYKYPHWLPLVINKGNNYLAHREVMSNDRKE